MRRTVASAGLAGLAGDSPDALFDWVMSHQAQVWLLEAGVAGAVAYAWAAYQQHPRGWARTDLVECRPSAVAGTGLFLKKAVAGGTVLGSYPGRPRSATEMGRKAEYAPLARGFAFQTDDGGYLDPTDAQGLLTGNPSPGLPYWPFCSSYSEALAYINEPQVNGIGPNCRVVSGASELELLFVTDRDLEESTELLIDYGRSYDRSSYQR